MFIGLVLILELTVQHMDYKEWQELSLFGSDLKLQAVRSKKRLWKENLSIDDYKS